MASNIPEGIGREHILAGIQDFENGRPHPFADSIKYDLRKNEKEYI